MDQGAVQRGLERAHSLVAAGQPIEALKVVAELLRAAGMEREAGESICRVQQALAAGSQSTQAANELATLLSLVSLQAAPQAGQAATPMGTQQQQQQQYEQQQQHLFHHHYQQHQPPGSGGGRPAEMEIDDGTGPGPPPGAAHPVAAGSSEAARLEGLAAAAEGASYRCPMCGGVVAVARQAAHQQLWCPALPQG